MNIRDRQILNITIPSIVSNITVPLLGLVDVGITGHLGSEVYVGAIAVGGMLFNIIYWLFAFLRMGTSGMTAQAFGRRDLAEVTYVLMRSIGVSLLASVIIVSLQWPIRECAFFFISSSPSVTTLATRYFSVCVYGAPAALALFAMTGWYIGMQNSRIPMLVAIVQNVCNIVVSLFLVVVLHMKIEGVAAGTVIAQYVGLAVAVISFRIYYMRRLRMYLSVSLLSCLSPKCVPVWNRKSLMGYLNVNRDIFLRTLCLVVVHLFFVSAGAGRGDTVLAVNTLLLQFFTLYSYIMDGFAFAGEAIAGKSIGSRNRVAYDDVVWRLFRWGCVMLVLFTIAYAVSERFIVALLTNECDVIDMSEHYRVWVLLIPLCGMAAFIWDGIYIGATATRQMLISMMTGVCVFLIVYYSLSSFCGNHALWAAFDAYLLTRGIVQTILRESLWR